MILGVFVEQLGGKLSFDKILLENIANLLGGDVSRVLDRNHHGGNAVRLAVDILDRNLSFVVRTEPGVLAALAELGYINEAYMTYKRILEGKDLPKHGSRNSEWASKAGGSNYHIDQTDKYHNDLTPEDDKNQAALGVLQKELSAEQLAGLKASCSPSVIE